MNATADTLPVVTLPAGCRFGPDVFAHACSQEAYDALPDEWPEEVRFDRMTGEVEYWLKKGRSVEGVPLTVFAPKPEEER